MAPIYSSNMYLFQNGYFHHDAGQWRRSRPFASCPGLRRTCGCRGTRSQSPDHFLIRDLPKIAIKLSDRSEITIILEAHGIVGIDPQVVEGIGRCDWYGEDAHVRTTVANGPQSRAHGRPGCNTVVDHDRGSSGDRDGRPMPDISTATPFDLSELTSTDLDKFRFSCAGKSDHFLIAHDEGLAAIGNRIHRQFRLKWDTDLADQQQIQRRMESLGHFRSDRYASARKRKYDGPLVQVFLKRHSEPAAGI